MKRRIDELLSPERLRDNWREPAAIEETPLPSAPEPPDHPLQLFARLERLARERFADSTLPVALLLEELRRRLAQRFPPAGEPEPGKEERAAAGQEIAALLDQLEDLVEVVDLPRR